MHYPPTDLESLTLTQGLRGLFNRLEPPRPDAQQLEAFVEQAFTALREPLHDGGGGLRGEARRVRAAQAPGVGRRGARRHPCPRLQLFDAAVAYGGGRPWDDDVTVMVIRRPGD